MNRIFLVFSIFIIAATNVCAQDKMETDRPGESQTPFLIPKKYFQSEIGFVKQNERNANYNLLYPTALLKYGISKRIEFDVELNYKSQYQQLIPNPKTTKGLEPVSIGTKISLLEEKGLLPKTSFIGFVGLPFLSSKSFKTTHLVPSFRLTMQNSITDKISLGYNAGAEWDGESAIPQWLYTLVTDFELGKKWDVFAEVYGSVTKNNLPEHSVDAGLSYSISNNMKADASAGFGLTDNAIKNFISFGFSFRLPTKR